MRSLAGMGGSAMLCSRAVCVSASTCGVGAGGGRIGVERSGVATATCMRRAVMGTGAVKARHLGMKWPVPVVRMGCKSGMRASGGDAVKP